MKCEYLVCTEGAVIDQLTGNLSLFNIIEQIGGVGFPLFIQRFVVVAAIQRTAEEPSEAEVVLNVLVNGTTVGSTPIALDFQGRRKTRTLTTIDAFVIPAPGTVRAELATHEGPVLGAYEFDAYKAGTQQMRMTGVGSPSGPMAASGGG